MNSQSSRPFGQIEIRLSDPDDVDAQHCLRSYLAELDALGMQGYDAGDNTLDAEQIRPPVGRLLLAYVDGRPMSCIAMTLQAPATAVVKRMWVAPGARRTGIGRQILRALETAARELGVGRMRLETRNELHAAIRLYRASGYHEVPPFTDRTWIHHWFEKRLH